MIVSLVGYMMTGKSTIGYKISKDINYKFIDLDDAIEKKENNSINNIINKKGNFFFRKLEKKILNQIIGNVNDNIILSLGGGTPMYYNNMDLITNNTISIYIRSSVDNLIYRYKNIKNKNNNRFILKNIEDSKLKAFIIKHLLERDPIYNKSLYTVYNDNNIEQCIEKIKNIIYNI